METLFTKTEKIQSAYDSYIEFLAKYPTLSKREIAETCCETWGIKIHELADIVIENGK